MKLFYCSVFALLLLVSCDDEPVPVPTLPALEEATVEADSVAPAAYVPLENDFATRFELDSSWEMSTMDSIVSAYMQADSTQKREMSLAVDDVRSRHLLAYACHTSIWSVRLRLPNSLKDGLAALAFENGRFDFKQSMAALSMILHSAEILDEDQKELLKMMDSYPANRFKNMLYRFLKRDAMHQEPGVFGYYEIREPDFDYIFRPLTIVPDSVYSDSLKAGQ